MVNDAIISGLDRNIIISLIKYLHSDTHEILHNIITKMSVKVE